MTGSFAPALRDHDGELAPTVFLIAHDDYHASHVGRTADGRQFFITTPFAPGAEFVARYLFDDAGQLTDAEVVPLGPRPGNGVLPGNTAAFTAQEETMQRLLDEVGPVSYGEITIAPFAVKAHGRAFGMVLNGPDPEDPHEEWYWSVNLEPGDFMGFYAPWDSGEYDT